MLKRDKKADRGKSKEEIREEEEKVLRQVRQSEMIFEKSATANLLPVPC